MDFAPLYKPHDWATAPSKRSGDSCNERPALNFDESGAVVHDVAAAVHEKGICIGSKVRLIRSQRGVSSQTIGIANRQTDKQTDTQTHRQTDRQTHRQTDKQTNRQTDRQIDRQADK